MKPPKPRLNEVFHISLNERLNETVRAREHAAYLKLAEFIRARVNAWMAKSSRVLHPDQFDRLWRDIMDHEAFSQISRRDREGALKALFQSIRRQLFLGRIEINIIPPLAPGKETFKEPLFPPPELEGDSDFLIIRADADEGVIVGQARKISPYIIKGIMVRRLDVPNPDDPKNWQRVMGHKRGINVFSHHVPGSDRDYDLEFKVVYALPGVENAVQFSHPTRISVVHELQEDLPMSEPVFEDPVVSTEGAALENDLRGGWFK